MERMFFQYAGFGPDDGPDDAEMDAGAERIRALIQWIDQMPRNFDCWANEPAECAVFCLSNAGVVARHLMNEVLVEYGYDACPEPPEADE